MLWLRFFAIASNVCFIIYGVSMDLLPIWLLHALLLPMNCRFWILCLYEKLEAKKSPIAVYHKKRRSAVASLVASGQTRAANTDKQTATARLANGQG